MLLAPKLFTIKSGQLISKQQSNTIYTQQQTPRIIKYNHFVRASPDEYHTAMIKQLKKQNQQLKIKYKDLHKAYLGVLGYCQDKLVNSRTLATPIKQILQDEGFVNSEICQSTSKQSQANVSSFDFDQIMKQTQQWRKKQNRLSQSILEQENNIQQFRQRIQQQQQRQQSPYKQKYQLSINSFDQSRKKAKTEADQNIQQLLIQAFKQVQELKELLEEVRSNSTVQIVQIRIQYEKKIQQLEMMLQKQRKQSRMLNSVINRMRQQIQSKQNFFRAVKQIKNGHEKIFIDKLLRQHRVSP